MIPDITKNLPPAPDDVVEWIQKECVRQSYMFYSKRKIGRAVRNAERLWVSGGLRTQIFIMAGHRNARCVEQKARFSRRGLVEKS